MKQKIKILNVLVITILLCGCGIFPNKDHAQVLNNEGIESQQVPNNSGNENPSGRSIIKESQLYHLGEKISIENITYQVDENIVVSKELHGFTKDQIQYYTGFGTSDEQGNLVDQHSYLYVPISVSNNLNEVQMMNIINLDIVITEGNNQSIINSFELSAFDKPQESIKKSSYGHFELQPKESVSFLIVFILPDDLLKDALYFQINPKGITNTELIETEKLPVAYIKVN